MPGKRVAGERTRRSCADGEELAGETGDRRPTRRSYREAGGDARVDSGETIRILPIWVRPNAINFVGFAKMHL